MLNDGYMSQEQREIMYESLLHRRNPTDFFQRGEEEKPLDLEARLTEAAIPARNTVYFILSCNNFTQDVLNDPIYASSSLIESCLQKIEHLTGEPASKNNDVPYFNPILNYGSWSLTG